MQSENSWFLGIYQDELERNCRDFKELSIAWDIIVSKIYLIWSIKVLNFLKLFGKILKLVGFIWKIRFLGSFKKKWQNCVNISVY